MQTDDHDVTALLAALRDTEPNGRPRTDIAATAVAEGTRIRARRRALLTTAVVLIAVVAVVVVPIRLLHRQVPPAAPQPPRATFGVLDKEFTAAPAAGWVPYAYETGRYRQIIHYKRAGTSDPETDGTFPSVVDKMGRVPTMDVVVFAPGTHPALSGGGRWDPASGTPAPPVHGHRAVYPAYNFQSAYLGWEWSPGAWAFVSAGVAVKGNIRSMAEAVAGGIRHDPGTPARTAFTVVAPRAPARLIGVLTPVAGVSDRLVSMVLFASDDDFDAPVQALPPADPRAAIVSEPFDNMLSAGPELGCSAIDPDFGPRHARGGVCGAGWGQYTDPGPVIATARPAGNPDDQHTWTTRPLR